MNASWLVPLPRVTVGAVAGERLPIPLPNSLVGCRTALEEEISDGAGLGRHLRCPVLGRE